MALNIEELRDQAKYIDKKIAYLREKMLEPSKLGYGTSAQSTIDTITNELEQVKNETLGLIEREKDSNQILSYNLAVQEASLHSACEKLVSLEKSWVKKTSYVPFHSNESRCSAIDISIEGEEGSQGSVESCSSSVSENSPMNFPTSNQSWRTPSPAIGSRNSEPSIQHSASVPRIAAHRHRML